MLFSGSESPGKKWSETTEKCSQWYSFFVDIPDCSSMESDLSEFHELAVDAGVDGVKVGGTCIDACNRGICSR